MEVFIRGVPAQATEKKLKKYFRLHLDKLCIKNFSCQKMGRYATLTFLHQKDAELFLRKHGHIDLGRGRQSIFTNATQLYLMNEPIYCTANKRPLDKHQLRSLQAEVKEEESRKARTAGKKDLSKEKKAVRKFDFSLISCGVWDYTDAELGFASHLMWEIPGQIRFRQRLLRLVMGNHQIEFPYSWIYNITVGSYLNISVITITSRFAPRMSVKSAETDLEATFGALSIHGSHFTEKKNKASKWKRISSIDSKHQKIVSSCLVYRVHLATAFSADEMKFIKMAPEIPTTSYVRTHLRKPKKSMETELRRLQQAFISSYRDLPFPIMFQMQRLAQNGYLSPSTVMELFPAMTSMARRSGTIIAVSAIRKLFRQVPYSGPEAEAHDFYLETLLTKLRENEDRSKREDQYSGESADVRMEENTANVFRAMVTPAGVYLSGPEQETRNRILRKYSDHLDYFLRVQFCDENGEPVRYDPRISNDDIWYQRFKNVLTNGIDIAGRKYGFLGFSHSSLRSQTCWFMAPFMYNGELQLYQMVIRKIGDFSNIRCPAKCAARIGQAFSDTPNTVPIGKIVVRSIPDVERNNRVFSDGVGTFSESVLEQVWDALPGKRRAKPTVFQIRYRGAKGMISLDSRISTHSLLLRPSMIKFSGSESTDIELCGAAYRPLPMFLNRQLIKILEDLGVTDVYFLDLQAEAVEQLRMSTQTTLSASKFLASHDIGEIVRLPWFMKQLISLSLFFHKDAFLRDVVELSVLAELRQLKYRARILVENGATLYGIMDETGILKEGEVFIILDVRPGVSDIVTGERIIVTRCPALHPGDVVLVRAVSVPSNSPLMKLTNCVCFSQKGQRDLPSKLSGGDLDGDLYNLIWDQNCVLRNIADPADYPRQDAEDILRPVERDDMTDFFIKFMATDQLGRIATTHQVLADQSDMGTFDERCLMLANMHSTAVDFSKTGIPVDMSLMPKYSRCRPDFLASGPHVNIESKDKIQFEDEDKNNDEEDDDDDEEDFQSYRYYESEKILGQLYRAIDEREVFRGIQQMGKKQDSPGKHNQESYSNTSLMDAVWDFVQRRCRSLKWERHLEWARDIREWYDDCILTIMEECSSHPLRPLSELEVFVGTILGATGKQNKLQRDMNISMKERFNKDVAFIINNIVKDGSEFSEEALERSIACFEVSFDVGMRKRGAHVISFKYVTAALCMKEIERSSLGRSRSNKG